MKNLFQELQKLTQRGYYPYSQFAVACLLELKDKSLIPGVNIENASYPCGICAERAAISQLISNGYNKRDVVAVYLYGSQVLFTYPCGLCRQVLYEMLESNTPLILFNEQGEQKQLLVNDLLPYNFILKS